MRKTIPGAAALAALALITACGSAATPSGGTTAPAATPTAPAVTWQPGGTYTGPVPPAIPMPGPRATLQLHTYTDPDGYVMRDSITFGVPLHYRVPQRLFDCSSSAAYQFDLPPGKVVIPIMISIKNLTPQQAPAMYPTLHTTDADGNYGVQITGASGSANMWRDGSCAQDVNHLLGAGGTDAVWGFIGPATPAQLAATYINVSWDGDASARTLTEPLHSLLPHQAASWLVTQGGQS